MAASCCQVWTAAIEAAIPPQTTQMPERLFEKWVSNVRIWRAKERYSQKRWPGAGEEHIERYFENDVRNLDVEYVSCLPCLKFI